MFPSSFVPCPSEPSAHTLTPPHPDLLSVTLTWLQLEKSKGWAACTFGSRLILVSRRRYLWPLPLPLYSLTPGTAWLVVLNRTPDLSTTVVSSFRASLGKCWSGRGESRKGGGPRWREWRAEGAPGTAPGCARSARSGCAGHSPHDSLLQVTTGHMKVRAELQMARHTFHPETPSPDTETCPGEEEELPLSFPH